VIVYFALIGLALAVLAKGGDLFVDSSLVIGRVLRVPRFVIGGTLVSLATTMPELVVSTVASAVGDSGIALGNAVGSCICNVGLIVGMVAFLNPVHVERRSLIKRAAWMVAAGVLVVIFTWDRTLERPLAAVLLGLAFAYLIWDFLAIRRQRDDAPALEGPIELKRAIVLFGLGLVLIVGGSWLLVKYGQLLALSLGLPSVIIGLSIVAIGTSLPELVTGVAAARKGVPDLSLGNILGANVLNLFLIVGWAGSVSPLTLTRFTQVYSYGWLGIFFAAFIGLAFRTGSFYRGGGVLLLFLYVLYVTGMAFFPVFVSDF